MKEKQPIKQPIVKRKPSQKKKDVTMKLEKYERLIEGKKINLKETIQEMPKSPLLRYDVSGGGEIVKGEKDTGSNGKKGLTPKQEMFCQYYVNNVETRFNATWSYAFAYGYDLEGADTEEIRDLTTGEIIKKSERKRLENICAVASKQTLRIIKVQDRVTELLNELKKDHIVDGEMMKMILQDHDAQSKRDMIKEYNKLMKRITDKLEHSGSLTLADGLIALTKTPQKEEK